MPTSAGSEEMGKLEDADTEASRSHHTEFWGLLSASTWHWFPQHGILSWGFPSGPGLCPFPGDRQEAEVVRLPWLSLTPSPQEGEATAHPRDRASSALCTCGSPWCRSRQRGPHQGHGVPSESAPRSPSGSHRASSSWSTAPTGTTRSFHIVLAGREGRGRERRGGGGHSWVLQNAPGEPLPPALSA